jgi:hypothetical protein
MKWMKQVFAQRYNVAAGRTGHIWGDRYWSQILEGEPPEVEEESATGDSPCWRGATTGVRPHKRGTATGVRPHKRGATTGVRPHKRGTATGVRPCWRERERSPCFSPSPPSPHPHNRA